MQKDWSGEQRATSPWEHYDDNQSKYKRLSVAYASDSYKIKNILSYYKNAFTWTF